MKQIVFDIEANGLDPDKVWCIIAYERDTKEYVEWSGDSLLCFKDWIEGAERTGGHWSQHYWLRHTSVREAT